MTEPSFGPDHLDWRPPRRYSWAPFTAGNVVSLQNLGKVVCAGRRAGVSLNDALSVLFDSPVAPTFAQAENLYWSAVANLCPPSAPLAVGTEYVNARPITRVDDLERRLGRRLTLSEAIALRAGWWSA